MLSWLGVSLPRRRELRGGEHGVKRITPEEAKELLDSERGFIDPDVHTVPEFEAGQMVGASPASNRFGKRARRSIRISGRQSGTLRLSLAIGRKVMVRKRVKDPLL